MRLSFPAPILLCWLQTKICDRETLFIILKIRVVARKQIRLAVAAVKVFVYVYIYIYITSTTGQNENNRNIPTCHFID
jgi:hypothetical protein